MDVTTLHMLKRVLVLLILLAIAWRLSPRVRWLRGAGARAVELLASRWAPLAIAVLGIIILSFAWGSWNETAGVHDEMSYLFQAKLFASGRWTAPPPPIPEFFEQYHLFVVPRYASKYPPGHALLLVPGIWLGVPGLMPVIIGGIAGALIFSIVRRLTNGVVALWTWTVWIGSPLVLWLTASYFSQSTSTLVWFLGWYALLRWRGDEPSRERWLLVVAACVAWLAFTRPLTAVAYALPIGAYVLWRVARTRRWGSLAAAMALGTAMLLVIPLWSVKTVGSWSTTPYGLYSRMYFPWDAPGFGLDTTPPLRALPPDMQRTAQLWEQPRREYVPSALPEHLARRTFQVGTDMWGGQRMILLPFAMLGLLALTPPMLFALGSGLILLLAYLWFGHAPTWSVYYIEIQPVLALLTALGLWRCLRWPTGSVRDRSDLREPLAPAPAAAFLGVTMVFAIAVGWTADQARDGGRTIRSYRIAFADALRTIPFEKSIVFVRYAPAHNPHVSLIENEPDLARARRWIVYDRGPDENARLMALAPDRVPLLYDEDSGTMGLYRLPVDSASPPTRAPDGVTRR